MGRATFRKFSGFVGVQGHRKRILKIWGQTANLGVAERQTFG